MSYEQVRERYRNDPAFARLVDINRQMIHELHLTPGEVRDAAQLASLIHEERKASPMFPADAQRRLK